MLNDNFVPPTSYHSTSEPALEPNGVREWRGRDKFNSFKGKKLNNGLSAEENRVLANTPHVDQAIVLILRGLTKATLGSHGGMVT